MWNKYIQDKAMKKLLLALECTRIYDGSYLLFGKRK